MLVVSLRGKLPNRDPVEEESLYQTRQRQLVDLKNLLSPDLAPVPLSKEQKNFMTSSPALPIVFASTRPIPESSIQSCGDEITKEWIITSPMKLGRDIDLIFVANDEGKVIVEKWLRECKIKGVSVYIKEAVKSQIEG